MCEKNCLCILMTIINSNFFFFEIDEGNYAFLIIYFDHNLIRLTKYPNENETESIRDAFYDHAPNGNFMTLNYISITSCCLMYDGSFAFYLTGATVLFSFMHLNSTFFCTDNLSLA